MLELGPSGRSKLADAQDAAVRFISGLRLSAGSSTNTDRVAIVSFNQQATTVQAFSSSANALRAALGRIQIASGSRVDLGIRRATSLIVAGGRARSIPAMIILSDGQVDAPTAIQSAREAQHRGVQLYIVGLGPEMNEAILRDMAPSPDRYFPAPDSRALSRIYADLTTKVPCPPAVFWAGR